jgi:nucleotide-binding universal stress UspA family protein
MFRRILVATGGSPWSQHAVDTAVRLATAETAELFIVHVLEDDPQYQPQALSSADPQFRAEMEATGKRILAQATQRAVQANVTHHSLSQWGAIPEQIVRTAMQVQSDLIVMGTRHLTGDKRLMTGRICNAVIATAPCPILVVPLVQESDGL